MALRARADFLDGRAVQDLVRPEILASWRRSQLCGARSDVDDLPYHDASEEHGRFLASAENVLRHVAQQLDGSTSALLLADASARILRRWAGSDALLRVMDTTGSAPGFSLSEEVCGTNGLGSIVEERRPFHVTGGEHFAERFLGYSCCGAPIVDPLTGRIAGIVTLVCRWQDANGLMLPFLRQAAEAVESRLVDEASLSEQYLLDDFVRASARKRHAVVAISERTIIATPTASRLLGPDHHAVLWEHVHEIVSMRRPAAFELSVGPRVLVCKCRPVIDGDTVHGALVELIPDQASAPTPAPVGAAVPVLRLPGRSRAWLDTLATAGRAVNSMHPVVAVGPPGSGKLELLSAMNDQAVACGRLVVADAGLMALDGRETWLRWLRGLLALPRRTVVVRHLERLDAGSARAIAAMLDADAVASSTRVFATLTTGVDDEARTAVQPLVDRFVFQFEVPPLSERATDIPDLVADIIRRSSRPRRTVAPDALQALVGAAWPGNVRELETVILRALHTRTEGDIALGDLPPKVIAGRTGALTAMEHAELDMILGALRKTSGNKQEAAAELGIARSTLYRKMRAFGVDIDRTAY